MIMGTDSAAQSSTRGVRLGATEAKQTARLFSSDVDLFEASGTGERAVAAAASLLARRQVQVLIGANASDADRLSRLAESRHIVFLNVSSRNTALRSACRRYTFHVEATGAMYATALRIAHTSAPGSAALSGSVVLWAPTLTRFGASELNKRFQAAFGAPMDGPAWAGWAAVKLASEAALRASSASPDAVVRYFESGPTQFDGHKGWPLSFRRGDHQLRQPLYVAAQGTRRANALPAYEDVPDLRALSSGGMGGNANRLLDALSAGAPTAACAGSQSQ
jgi:ABC-type branched-subunit amino acid transport system substrate-binding protein